VSAAPQIVVFLVLLTGLALLLGPALARVLERPVGPLEARVYRLTGVDPDDDMSWGRYARALLLFSLLGGIATYAFQALQPTPVPPAVAFDTAVSFVTNTNWQAYAGEVVMTHLTQMAALTVQNFVSAATGIAVLVALIRGFTRRERAGLGNFWVDLTRTTVFILLPLSFVLAIALVSQGVVQTFATSREVTLLDPQGETMTQILALGPAASQVAIKQLGTNGGGFFNANSAHPFENPTPLSNLLELLAILLLPAALCFTFGTLVRDRRQGWVVFAAMMAIFVPLLVADVAFEHAGNPALVAVDQTLGNLEGKEVRFGATGSAMWAVATTAASNGSVNAMHDSFTPLGGLVPLFLIQLGEVVFGGVGSGLYGMLVYALIAVFLAGLMVGRSPEYLGKKIEAFEMKMAALVLLLPAAATLLGTALAVSIPAGTAPLGNPGPHGFTEILYAFSSGANNNGSAFGGLTVSGDFYAIAIAVCMLIGRFGVILPVLAIAGSLAGKKVIPASSGTLPTHTPLFVLLLVGTVLLVGALTFVPSLALGPVVEHLSLRGQS
jgi:potassium-transporting ATPase potassium-binding subunit